MFMHEHRSCNILIWAEQHLIVSVKQKKIGGDKVYSVQVNIDEKKLCRKSLRQ
jgi:hypothetical protein